KSATIAPATTAKNDGRGLVIKRPARAGGRSTSAEDVWVLAVTSPSSAGSVRSLSHRCPNPCHWTQKGGCFSGAPVRSQRPERHQADGARAVRPAAAPL